MKYLKIFSPENENWCVPATIQTMLNRRNIRISQYLISQDFKRAQNGFYLTNQNLNDFLGRFSLNSEFYNPFLDIIELDLFLKDRLQENDADVMALYDLSKIFGEVEEGTGHASLVSGYFPIIDAIELSDSAEGYESQVPFSALLEAIHPSLNRNYGFYLIK